LTAALLKREEDRHDAPTVTQGRKRFTDDRAVAAKEVQFLCSTWGGKPQPPAVWQLSAGIQL